MRSRPWGRPALQSEALVPADTVAALVAAAIEQDGFALWRARGQSMLGAIRDGQTVRLVAPRALRRGSVVMAPLADGRLVLHRVHRLRGDEVILRGDTCRRADGCVAVDSVVALCEPTPRSTLRSLLYRILP